METIDRAVSKAIEELSEAFVRARTEHRAIIEDYDAKRAAVSAFGRVGSTDYQRLAAKAQAEAAFRAASDTVRGRVTTVWDTFDGAAGRIREDLAATLEAAGTLDPDAVDEAGIELLKSGLARSADFEALAERYADDDNMTMLRLIGKYGAEYLSGLDAERDSIEIAKMHRIGILASMRGTPLDHFDELVKAARTLTGRGTDGRFIEDPLVPLTAADAWEQIAGA